MTLNEYLEAESLTQQQFADLLGVTQGLVSQWARGALRVSADMAKQIEEATSGGLTRSDLRPDLWEPSAA